MTYIKKRGYTFVGNVENWGLDERSLTQLKKTHPKYHAFITHPTRVAQNRDRFNSKFGGLVIKIRADAFDIHGELIQPHGAYLAIYVMNTCMPKYNKRCMRGRR